MTQFTKRSAFAERFRETISSTLVWYGASCSSGEIISKLDAGRHRMEELAVPSRERRKRLSSFRRMAPLILSLELG